ncbi:glycoside hydrolase family 97 protein [Flagellimonas zhangzhouensis]|uniref:Glycosyl-hydrolase 97 C-terminal, oligomerisation n=1 Tax=Flagellimonas zhangzhouensis TaxID=1073328 RepID=A0A1H2QBB6_9FLAO|nr:glycoside hydrolase family 97 protein [Allomuricauda zhangzhouensis]SDQ51106.1 Glycosyl-hydrolase 97 C-terminal, oligomerisation [Allomuricauda zhangzhouensis]SDW04523.1 Glycosyl-hydrolase 97 C-terminal, oligomerisation [Allomuricauda zhangzhouensis]
MKFGIRHITTIFFMASLILGCEKPFTKGVSMSNVAGTIRAELNLDGNGQPYYLLYHQNELVLDTSYLGLKLEGMDLSKNLKFSEVKPVQKISDSYQLFHGKQKDIIYNADRYSVIFNTETGQTLECQFDLSENGFAYRYLISGDENQSIAISEEASSYGFPEKTKAWMQPMSKAKTGWSETNPSYEEHYLMEIPVNTSPPIGEGYVYPALFNTNDTWLLVSESDLHENYAGTRLKYDENLEGLQVTFPQKEEIFPGGGLLPKGQTSIRTPWRTVAVGGLNDIVESTLGTDLAAPAIDMDTSFVQGGLATWSWVLLKDDRIDYETSHQFIDYAASMNWPYTLIDVNWDQKIGFERMQELIDYAASKNVKVILWYNSSGDWNSTPYTPKSKLLTKEGRRAEFERLQKMGVGGLKIDFFGGDGQSMIAYYHDILKDAAEFGLLINFHGATLPRGWQRTYPHLMTMESIKGQEFITFEQPIADLQPSHSAVIPFTRNVYDPMDFTPMVLDSIPNINRRTTTTFELALPILFTSGIQHIAEIPEGIEKMPDSIIELLQGIPTQWDEVKFLDGYPGKEIILARRKGNDWYIVGINGEAQEKIWDLDLSFTANKSGILFYDNGTKVPGIENIENTIKDIKVDPNGGFVIKI